MSTAHLEAHALVADTLADWKIQGNMKRINPVSDGWRGMMKPYTATQRPRPKEAMQA
jgi:hypothetical protein